MSKQIGGAKGGGGGSPREPIDVPESLQTRAIIEVIDVWGIGEIEGFPNNSDPLSYVYLDGTPVKSSGVLNFQGVTFDFRTGTQSQSYIPGYVDDTIGSPEVVNVSVTHATPHIVTINDPSTDAVRVVLSFQGLYYNNTTNGDRYGAEVYVEIDVNADNAGWVGIDLGGRGSIIDKVDSPFQRSYHINLRQVNENATSYQVRVRRASADPAANVQNAFKWDSIVKLTYAKLRRPNVAYCRITFDAKYFSSVPVRSYKLRGWRIQVPTADVYDPVARTYTGADWSGGLVKRWCRNPAWFLYHLLTTAGAGLGEDINPAYQDKWQIYTIAKRCDELVPDGAGGYEPRYSIDGWFAESVSAHDMVQQLAGIFDAMPLWNGSSVYLTQDAPKAVSSLFLPANVVDGRFAYSGTGRQVRYTTAYIQYNDPTDQYRITTEAVEDFDGIQRYGYRPKTEVAVGCVSRGQAHRRGKRLLVSAREEIDSVVFSAGLNALKCRPGDIVRVADPLRAVGNRYGGRIASDSTASSINLDAPVILAGGTSYRLSIIGNDGLVKDSDITNASGTHSVITVSPAFSEAPQAQLEWIVYDPLAIGQTYRILTIVENEDNKNGIYTLSATQYSASKFEEIDSVANLEQIPDNPYIVNGVIPPSGIITNEGVYVSLEGILRYIDISWTASNDPLLRGYVLRITHNGALVTKREITGTSYRIRNPLKGTYKITLAAINIVGRTSVSITVDHILGDFYLISAVSITGLTLVPYSAAGEFTGQDARFDWDTNADQVLALSDSYGIGPGGSTPWFRDFEVRIFDGATLVGTHYCTETAFNYQFGTNISDGGPRRTFTLKVRARDYYGQYSQEAALTVTNPPPSDFGAVEFTPGPNAIFVNYTKPTDSDYRYTRVYASQTPAFSPSPLNLVGETTDRVSSFPINAPGYWYIRLQGVDAFGLAGTVYSTEFAVFVTTASIDITAAVNQILEDPGKDGDVVVEASRFLVVQPGTSTPQKAVFGVGQVDGVPSVGIAGDLVLDGTFYGRSVVAHSLAADKLNINQLSAITADFGTMTAGTIKTSTGTSWRVELSDVGGFPIWYGSGTKIADNGKFFLDNAGNAFFGGAINVNNLFTVAANGTVTIRDASNNVVFSSGSGADWTYMVNKPDSLFDINNIEWAKLDGISAGATKNTIFRQGGTVPVGVNGDIWFVSSDTAGYVTGATYLYTTSWGKVADITTTQLAGSGVNVVNPRYATFEEAGLPPISGLAIASLDNTTGFVGSKSIKIAAPLSPGLNCYLGTSSTDFNFPITPNNKWIVSFYVKSSGVSCACHVRLRINSLTGFNVSGVTSATADTWTRISGVVNLSNNASTQAMMQLNNDTFETTPADIWFDGLMVEAQLGDKTEPSVYHEPPNFLTTFLGDLDANKTSVYRQASAPSGSAYTVNDLWFDTDAVPPTLYQWNGSAWAVVSNTIVNTDELIDGAGLGTKAIWTNITGTGKPANGATVNHTYVQAAQPSSGMVSGDIWIDTDDSNKLYVYSGTAWTQYRDAGIQTALTNAANAQAAADGKIDSFFQTGAPASGMATGDLWFDTDDGNKLYRYSGSAWVVARDDGISIAIGAASNAQATADGKVVTFFSTSTPTGQNLGDLWFNSSNNLLNRWSGTAWSVVSNNYTNTLELTDGAGLGTKATWTNITGTGKPADGATVNHTFVQASQPATGMVAGDIWIDTDDSNKLYVYSGTVWTQYRDAGIQTALTTAANAQAAADGKIDSFFQTGAPTSGMATGDLWFDTDDGNKLYRYSGSTWVVAQDDGISVAIGAASNAQATADGKVVTFFTTTTPLLPSLGDLWFNSSNNLLKRWSGSAWSVVSNNYTDTLELTDGAELGQTALWAGVSGIPYETIFNNDDAVALGFNPSFADWTGTLPKGWINTAGANPTKGTVVRSGYPWSVKFVATGVDQRIRCTVNAILPVGTFISGSIDMYLESVTSGLPGINVELFTNAGLTTSVITRAQPVSAATGVWIRVPFSARVGLTQQIYGIRVVLGASLSSYPSGLFTGVVYYGNLKLALFDNTTDNTTIKLSADGSLSGGGGGSVTITGLGYTGDLNATNGAPAGTLVGGVSADLIAQATTNYNASNDRNPNAIAAPVINNTGLAIDHTTSTSGDANISFEWTWSGAEGDIDGFQVFVRQHAVTTLTFDASLYVSDADDHIYFSAGHSFNTGVAVVYSAGGSVPIPGLTDGSTYYVIKVDANRVRLAATLANAFASSPVLISPTAGANHKITGGRSFVIGNAPALETAYTTTANKRAFILLGVPSTHCYTFGVCAYRVVDKDVNASGVIRSAIVQPVNTATVSEDPYRPATNVAFDGDVTGTVFGEISSGIVRSGNKITAGNASTFIDNAAINRAHIGALNVDTADIVNLAVTTAKINNLAVTNAKINDLSVSTLKIQNNAVTVPAGSSGQGPGATPNVTMDALGSPVIVIGTMNIKNTAIGAVEVKLLMDGVVQQSMFAGYNANAGEVNFDSVSIMLKINASSGDHQYMLTSSNTAMHLGCAIVALGVKK
jgi:hypothetical protein